MPRRRYSRGSNMDPAVCPLNVKGQQVLAFVFLPSVRTLATHGDNRCGISERR